MFSLGIIIVAIAVGNLYSAPAGWLLLGVGLVVASVVEMITGKELD